MKFLVHTIYRLGDAGLSNAIISLELGVVLAALTDRVLVLKGNASPPGNVVQYPGMLNRYPSRVTDLLDLGVPWTGADQVDLAGLPARELCERPVWECVFYFPSHLSATSEDARNFAGTRSTFLTIDGAMAESPVLSFSGGPEGATLSFYSYFFYLDPDARSRAHRALLRMRPKSELAAFARKVAHDLGAFNAVHVRRGDFKKVFGVTTLNRTPAEAIEALDHHFARNRRLVILTDEADDPFFEDIKAAFRDHLFIDRHILENHREEFFDLPAHDSIALAYLSQLIAAESADFIGTMTSTFTALIQRMRGNAGKDEPFKFLWNELPSLDDPVERGRHPPSDCVPLDRGVMVEQCSGPYSWNRFNDRLNPAWMREWPEAFLTAATSAGPGRDGALRQAGAPTGVRAQDPDPAGCMISFLDCRVAVTTNRRDLLDAICGIFGMMIAPPHPTASAELRLEARDERAALVCDGRLVAESSDPSRLLRALYREVVCRFIECYPDLIWVHASCAASPPGAVVLPAEWGRGKSSLVVELYRRGWLFLADDVVAIDARHGCIIPFPGTPQIRSRLGQWVPRERLGKVPKKPLPLDPDQVARTPAPLCTIVFPHCRDRDGIELSPVSPGQAVARLLENCLSFVKNDDRTVGELCARAAELPAYELHFADPGQAAELLIKAHTRSLGPRP